MTDFRNVAVSGDSPESNALLSNALLVERFRNHDPSAMTTLVARYYHRVFAACFRILGHRQDAEDATQETFSRFAKYCGRWDPRRPLEPWLIAIAGNRCRTQLSRRRSFAPLQNAAEPSSDTLSQEQNAEALREEVECGLRGLPGNLQDAFNLFHEDGLSYQDIARVMDRPVGTIKTWVHRARIQLIEHLRRREVLHVGAGEAAEQHTPGDES